MSQPECSSSEDKPATYTPPRVSRFSIEMGLKAIFGRDREAHSASGDSPLFIGVTSPGSWQSVLAQSMRPAFEVVDMGALHPCPIDALGGHVRMFRPNWPQPGFFKPRKTIAFGSNYAPAINGYPELSYLVDAHRDWFEMIVRGCTGQMNRLGMGWGAISHRWLADHAFYFRWLFPRAKIFYVIANPYVSWLQYRREQPEVASAVGRLQDFARDWRTATVDIMERHQSVNAAAVPWEQLAQPKVANQLQEFLRFEFPLTAIQECLSRWTDRNLTEDEQFEVASLRDGVADVAKSMGYECPVGNSQPAPPAKTKLAQPTTATAAALKRNTEAPSPPSRCVVLVPYMQKIEPVCEQALRGLEDKGYAVRRVHGIFAIDVARNILVTKALADGFEEILWVDDDMSFPPDAVDVLRAHREPLIGGIVAKRGQRAFASIFLDETKKLHLGVGGGVIEVLQMGTGFLLTHREVYEAIYKKFDLPTCVAGTGEPCVPYFMPQIISTDDGHWYMAEDYAFVNRAKQCGYRILADTTLRLGHIGSYEYAWEDVGLERKKFDRFSIDF
jgi:hypothetical protein